MNLIQTENARAGSTGYILTQGALQREIEGYWSETSVDLGGSIDLMVQSGGYSVLPHALSDFTLKIYRMGYYGGLGGRLVLDAGTITGVVQPEPYIYSNYPVGTPTNGYHGTAECNWTSNYTLAVPSNWVSGIYIAVLTRVLDGTQCQTIFCVRDDARSSADILAVQPVYTYHAYNRWGGRSAYGATYEDYPEFDPLTDWGSTANVESNRQSFNRPYAKNGNTDPWAARTVGSGRFFAHNGPNMYSAGHDLVMWLEREGYDVRYCTSVDRSLNAGLMMEGNVVLTMEHDEYVTQSEYDHLIARRDAGKHLMMLAGNDFYWRVRLEVDGQGRANRLIANYKDNGATEDKLVLLADRTDWFAKVAPQPEETLLGTQWFGGIGGTSAGGGTASVNNPTHWAWAGTGVVQDQAIPGIVGHEWNFSWTLNNYEARFGAGDRVQGSPPGVFTSLLWRPGNPTATDKAQLFDAGIYQAPSGAWVFHGGCSWYGMGLGSSPVAVPDYRANLESTQLKTLTANVLSAMGANPGGGTAMITYEAQVSHDGTNWSPLYSGQADLEEAVDPSAWPEGTTQVRHRARNTATDELSGWSLSSYTVAATAPAENTATGVGSLPALVAAGASTVDVAATGAGGLPALLGYGTVGVVPPVQVAAVATLPALSGGGVASILPTGEGAVALPAIGGSGAADVENEIATAASLPAIAGGGAAKVEVDAEGENTLPALSAGGLANIGNRITVAAALPGLEGVGTASMDTRGAAAVGLPSLAGSASADMENEISAAPALPALVAAGIATGDSAGVGAVSVPALIGGGFAEIQNRNLADIMLPALTGSGSAISSVLSAGTVWLPALSGSGSTIFEIAGVGPAILPMLRSTGLGSISITGMGAGRLPMLAISVAIFNSTVIPIPFRFPDPPIRSFTFQGRNSMTEPVALEMRRQARTRYAGSLADHVREGITLSNPELRAERAERQLVDGSYSLVWVDRSADLIEDGSVEVTETGVEIAFWKAKMEPSSSASLQPEFWRLAVTADCSDGEVIVGTMPVALVG